MVPFFWRKKNDNSQPFSCGKKASFLPRHVLGEFDLPKVHELPQVEPGAEMGLTDQVDLGEPMEPPDVPGDSGGGIVKGAIQGMPVSKK